MPEAYTDAEVEDAARRYLALGTVAVPFRVFLGIHVSARRGEYRRVRGDCRGRRKLGGGPEESVAPQVEEVKQQ